MKDIKPINISHLMQKYSLKPRKGLGQNFLVDDSALLRIVESADLSPGTTVLEIGAGLGHLTRYLAVESNQVVAVELDPHLITALKEVVSPYEHVKVVQGDILKLSPSDLISEKEYVIVANIPYYITSAIIRHLLTSEVKPLRMVLTMQYEVARRICAVSGDMSVLALSVLVFGEPYITSRIPAAAFYPPPKVDSASVRVDLYPRPVVAEEDLERFFKLVKAGFKHRRKTLRNSFSAGMGWKKERAETLLQDSGIDSGRRAQTLSISEWIRLIDTDRKMD